MKKIAVAIIIGALLALGIYSFGWYDTHYTRKDCVVVSYTENTVTFEDEQGHLWEAYTQGLEYGDKVDLVMFTNYTDNTIKDDVIKKIKKS